jgi:hypothetical protein
LENTFAHVLEIFDACYAGNLAGVRGRGGFCNRSFELIAAASADAITNIPGETSFTHALIWALNRFCDNNSERFTIDDLVQKIKECPTFPKRQFPVVSPRNKGRAERIILAPLSKEKDSIKSQRIAAVKNLQDAASKSYLQLTFVFDDYPSRENIDALAEHMQWMKPKDIPVTGISWVGLRPDPIIEAANKFLWHISKQRLKSKSLNSHITPSSPALGDVPDVPVIRMSGDVLAMAAPVILSEELLPPPLSVARRHDDESASYYFKMLLKRLGRNTSKLFLTSNLAVPRPALYSLSVLVIVSHFVSRKRFFRKMCDVLLTWSKNR